MNDFHRRPPSGLSSLSTIGIGTNSIVFTFLSILSLAKTEIELKIFGSNCVGRDDYHAAKAWVGWKRVVDGVRVENGSSITDQK
jgi:hypothetical protein